MVPIVINGFSVKRYPPMARGFAGLGDVASLAAAIQAGKIPTPQYQHGLSYMMNTPAGPVSSAVPFTNCADDATAQAIADALGGQVVKLPAVNDPNAASAVPLCNYITYNGVTDSAANLAYYATVTPSGSLSLAQMLANELGQGGQIEEAGLQYDQTGGSYLPVIQAANNPYTPLPINSIQPIVQPAIPVMMPPNPPQIPWTNPTPQAAAQQPSPSTVMIAPSSGVVNTGTQPITDTSILPGASWFTDAMIPGIPNWALLAAGVGALFLLGGHHGK